MGRGVKLTTSSYCQSLEHMELSLHMLKYVFTGWKGISSYSSESEAMIYEGGPKNNENFFYGGERGGTSVCSRSVRVRDCPPHQLAKRRPWGKVYRVRVIFFLSLCRCFRRFFDGRLKRTTCLHRVLSPFGENSSTNCHNASRGF